MSSAAADNARANLARTALARSEKLAAVQAASIEELEQRNGDVKQAVADRNAAAAQVRQADLNVSFTQIRAPIDGRVGRAAERTQLDLEDQSASSESSRATSLAALYKAWAGDCAAAR